MDKDPLVNFIQEIASYLGPTFRLQSHPDTERLPDITNDHFTIHIHYSEWKKKFGISVSPFSNTHEQRRSRHDILYQRLSQGSGYSNDPKWNLSINCSVKSSEKIARDIQRRLIPDATAMAAAVEAKEAEMMNNRNTLGEIVAKFKSSLGPTVRIRDHHENNKTSEFRWSGHICEKDSYRTIAEIQISRMNSDEPFTMSLKHEYLSLDTGMRVLNLVLDGKETY